MVVSLVTQRSPAAVEDGPVVSVKLPTLLETVTEGATLPVALKGNVKRLAAA